MFEYIIIYMVQTFKNCKMIDSKIFPYTNVSQPPDFSLYRQQKLPTYLCPYRNIALCKQVHKNTHIFIFKKPNGRIF